MDGMYEQNQMPHSNEAEQSVLGAIIIDPELINTTQEVLLPESFYRGAHQHIFRAMMTLNEDNKDIDVVTIMDQLSQEGRLSEAGGPQYLAELTNNVPTTRNVQYYTEIVFKHATKRKLIQAADSIANDGYNDELELDTILNDDALQIWLATSQHQQLISLRRNKPAKLQPPMEQKQLEESLTNAEKVAIQKSRSSSAYKW